jgi:hypothetical protein
MEGERRGEWGVKGEGKCCTVSDRGGVVGAAGARGGGGGGGARSGFRRKKTAGLTDRGGTHVSEGEEISRLGWEGRCGPRLGWKGMEEAGPKPLLGLKSQRVKEN